MYVKHMSECWWTVAITNRLEYCEPTYGILFFLTFSTVQAMKSYIFSFPPCNGVGSAFTAIHNSLHMLHTVCCCLDPLSSQILRGPGFSHTLCKNSVLIFPLAAPILPSPSSQCSLTSECDFLLSLCRLITDSCKLISPSRCLPIG